MIGYALCGSFCTFKDSVEALKRLREKYGEVIPIMSFNAYNTDTRFGEHIEWIQKIEEICALLEDRDEASLFFLLKDADSRAELVARFMGVLELIKIQRIKITSIKVIEDVVEYEVNGLEMMFSLNPDYIPGESSESEFDAPATEENEENK